MKHHSVRVLPFPEWELAFYSFQHHQARWPVPKSHLQGQHSAASITRLDIQSPSHISRGSTQLTESRCYSSPCFNSREWGKGTLLQGSCRWWFQYLGRRVRCWIAKHTRHLKKRAGVPLCGQWGLLPLLGDCEASEGCILPVLQPLGIHATQGCFNMAKEWLLGQTGRPDYSKNILANNISIYSKKKKNRNIKRKRKDSGRLYYTQRCCSVQWDCKWTLTPAPACAFAWSPLQVCHFLTVHSKQHLLLSCHSDLLYSWHCHHLPYLFIPFLSVCPLYWKSPGNKVFGSTMSHGP